MDVSLTFKLYDKQLVHSDVVRDVEPLNIYGLAELHVCPNQQGFGRRVLELLIAIGITHCKFTVVGFAADDVIEFYKKCGWAVNWRDKKTDKWVISATPIPKGFVPDGDW